MKTICAGYKDYQGRTYPCGALIKDGPDDGQISHGTCEPCLEKFKKIIEEHRSGVRRDSIFSAVAVLGSVILCALLLLCGRAEANETAILTIMGEAASEPLEAQIAVAEVIRNRAALRGQTIEQVCLAPRQFSFWNDRARAARWLRDHGHGDVYQRASRAWYESEETRLTRGADLYYNPQACRPLWNFALLIPRGQFGQHVFYKEKKA